MNDILGRTDKVNEECCDESNDHCAAGIPTTCDARCAMTYLSYHTDCAQQISASFVPEQQAAFARLANTCSSLPLEPLLHLMSTAQCASPWDANPCTCVPADSLMTCPS